MLTRLREAIDECEIFPVAGELKEALELRSRLDAKISLAVGDFDAAGLYELDQATSIHRCVMEGRSAILDYGTTTRTVPAPLWNALVLRDTHCRARAVIGDRSGARAIT
jgi:hypothetical protein